MVTKRIWLLCKKHIQIAMALKRWEFVFLSCNAAGAVWGLEGSSAPLGHAGIQAPAICDSAILESIAFICLQWLCI